MPELDRRDFLKLVGVSAGGAAASGCSDHVEKLIPYVVQPEEITPGIAVEYASTCLECPAGCGLHVRTREGRPIKLEGNPEHPINRGALCGRGQASIGRSYHPDRFRGPMLRGADGSLQPTTWEEAVATLADRLRTAGGGARVLGGSTGPTLGGLIDAWLVAVGGGERLVYEPFGYESLREASRAVFGVASQPIFDLDDTDLVVDFGADVLDTWVSPPEHQRQLENARDVDIEAGRQARLVSVGPRLSVTAGNADTWLPARPGSEGLVALALARVAFERRRADGKPVGGDAELVGRLVAKGDVEKAAVASGLPAQKIRELGENLATARRPVALPPGVALTGRNATASVGAVLLLNAAIGAVGTSVKVPPESGAGAPASFAEVARFIDDMKSGRVPLLLVHDSNPVYSLPPESGFGDALDKVGFVVSFASLPDETTAKADLILPDHTPMESWGDSEPRPGVRSIVQPTLRPLFDTQALGDTLLATARALGAGSALPEGSFRSVIETAWAGEDWRAALARGGVFRTPAVIAAEVQPSAAGLDVGEAQLAGEGDFILLPFPSPLLYDGRGASLPWLQETPDPVTKIAWQSWVEVSRATAEELGIDEGDVVAVETAAGRLEAPIYPRGGLRDDVVALAIGQGHTVGRFASAENDGRPGEARGVNVIEVLPAATDEKGGRAWLTTRAKLTPTGEHRRLPNTQRQDNKRARKLGEVVSLAALAQAGEAKGGHGEEHGDGHGGGGHHEMLVAFDRADDSRDESPYRWGLTIDLDRCSGCSACVVACAIENNIPNVGEEGVLRNRQMSWLRIERYAGEGDQELLTGRQRPKDREELGDTDVRHSPMMCQQCGAAPCEPVCPVMATYHSPEGLNGMIYNRCIGTRYCSNNCPYKVRRYNWFDYAIEKWPDPMQFMLNPDVTVRGQGVMEKCTFCIQRIEGARQPAKDAGRAIADGEVTTACAQTCPSQAITFGNVKNEASRAAKLVSENEVRAYTALHELNTRPGVAYLAKVDRSEEKHG